MSTGDDNPKRRNGRGRGATRPPTIDLEASEVAAAEVDRQAGVASPDTANTELPPNGLESAAGAGSDVPPMEEQSGDPTSGIDRAGPATPLDAAAAPGDAPSEPSPIEDDTPGPRPDEDAVDADAGDDEAPPPDGPSPETGTVGTPPPVPLPTARRASVIAAGLVGALIALAIYLGLYYGGVLPREAGVSVADLNAQIQQLVRRTAALEASATREARRGARLADTRIAELEKALSELGSDPKNTVVRRIATAEQKVEDLASRLESAAPADDLGTRLSALEDKVAALAAAPVAEASGSQAPAARADDTRLAAIEQRLSDIESRPAAATDASGEAAPDADALSAMSGRVAALEESVKTTQDAVAAFRAAEPAADTAGLAELESKLADLQGQVEQLGKTTAARARSDDDRLAALQKALDQRDDAATRQVARSAAGALAVAALARAVEAGGSYDAELSAVRPLVDDTADLEVLSAHAGTGVPDAAALARGFSAVSGDIVAAGAPQPSGLIDTLTAGARSLVRVRRDDAVAAGSGTEADVARIEAALESGDLPAARAAWESLDEAARQASRDWAAGLEARIAVDNALAGLSASLAGALTGTPAPVQN